MEKSAKPDRALLVHYALSGGLNTALFTFSGLYLAMFMTDHLKIDPSAMANGLLLVRGLDLAVSVGAGPTLERLRRRPGGLPRLLRRLTVPLALGAVLQLWDTSSLLPAPAGRLALVMGAYLLFQGAVDFFTPARSVLLPRFCGADMDLRKRFTVRQNQLGSAAVLLGSAATAPLAALLGRVTGRESWGYTAVMLLTAAVFAVENLLFCRAAGSRDPAPAGEEGGAAPALREICAALGKNGQMLVLFVCFSLFTMGNQLYAGMLAYYFRVNGVFALYPATLTARAAAAVAATLAAPSAAKRLGKKGVLVLSWGLAAAAGLAAKGYALPGGQAHLPVMVGSMCLWQAAVSLYMSFQAVYWLDCGEYGCHATGQDCRAMAVTVMNWPNKIGLLLGGTLIGWLLSWAGYVPPAGDGPGAVASPDRFMTALGLLPGLLAGLAAVGVGLFYKLTDAKAAEYARENREKEQRGRARGQGTPRI